MKSFLSALAAFLLLIASANAQNANDTTTHSKNKHELKAAKREEKKRAKHNKATADTLLTKEAKRDNKAVKRDEAASRKTGAKNANKETFPLHKHH